MKKDSKNRGTKGATKRKEPFPIGRLTAYAVKLGVACLLIGAFGYGIRYVSQFDWQLMPVKDIDVQSHLIYQDQVQLDTALGQFLSRSLLWLSVDEVRTEIEALPWISQVVVQKKWPGLLEIEVMEHEPIAQWNDDQVLNSDGLPLERPNALMNLARLNGPQRSSEFVMKQYLQFTQIFEELGVQLEAVTMYPRGSWSIKLSNGILISLGDKNVIERSRRVIKLLKLDAYKAVDIEYIDARYTNGIALKVAS